MSKSMGMWVVQKESVESVESVRHIIRTARDQRVAINY